ncbi:MAG: mannosyltransferase [Solirubrobacterales bacterium]|nr:mannosyltransferase [Solirubrobacterales bacterium]
MKVPALIPRDGWRLSPHLWLLLAIVAAGGLVRFLTLGIQSLDHDEAVTAANVLQPHLGATLQIVPESERTPHLYYILAWGWSQLFGTGAIGLRSLSALLGTLTIPVAYLAARELASPRAGLLAAALVAFNPFLIWFSQEARAYALFILLASAGLLLFARALWRQSARSYLWWATVSALALASHYFAAFLVAPEALWLLIAARRRLAPALATAGIGLTTLALLPVALDQQSDHTEVIKALRLPVATRVVNVGVSFASGQRLGPRGVAATSSAGAGVGKAAAVVLALALLAAAVILAKRGLARERRGALIAVAIAACGLLAPLALALAGTNYFDVRNESGLLVPLLVALAIGLGSRRARRLGPAIAATACAAFAVATAAIILSPSLQRPDWRSVASIVGDHETPRLVIAPISAAAPLVAYLRDDLHPLLRPIDWSDEYGHLLAGRVLDPAPIVREIDLVGVAVPAAPRSPFPGFAFAGSRRVGSRQVSRFDAPSLRRVDLVALERRGVIGRLDRLLFDPSNETPS